MTEFVDVVIVGAGISGISAAWHLQDRCPDKSYLILERRDNLGGTWDLFKYPGIRSDSDMFTLGFRFKPWTSEKAIADGPSIMAYLQETVDEYGIDKHIRYGHKVVDRFPVTVGGPGTETPPGRYGITDGVSFDESPYYGCCALALSGHQYAELPAGWIGGNRFWRVVFVLLLARRAFRKIMGSDPITVAVEQIKPGETLILRGVSSRDLPAS